MTVMSSRMRGLLQLEIILSQFLFIVAFTGIDRILEHLADITALFHAT